ncbi:MAG: class I SAM-dependent methyltransferase [Chloroflexota bacterium]
MIETTFQTHDFAKAWQNCTRQDPHHRGDSAVDLAFWAKHGRQYDRETAVPSSCKYSLAFIQNLIQPTDTVLDIGCGSGRFTLPLAKVAHRITAVDHSPDMLNLLENKLHSQKIDTVSLINEAWETAVVEQHDVVIAAWSLYRMPDLLNDLKKMVNTAKKRVIIVSSPGSSMRHDPILSQIWPQFDEMSTPLHIYFYGILWQAGVHAQMHIVEERKLIHGNSAFEIAAQLAPEGAETSDINTCAGLLTPHLTVNKSGLQYEQLLPVAMIHWERKQTG